MEASRHGKKAGQETLELFQKINKEIETTLLLVTRSTALAKRSGRVLAMSEGKVVKEEAAKA